MIVIVNILAVCQTLFVIIVIKGSEREIFHSLLGKSVYMCTYFGYHANIFAS